MLELAVLDFRGMKKNVFGAAGADESETLVGQPFDCSFRHPEILLSKNEIDFLLVRCLVRTESLLPRRALSNHRAVNGQRYLPIVRFFCRALNAASARAIEHCGCSPEREYETLPHTGHKLRTAGK